MAGTKGRSGRRQQFKDFSPSAAAPELQPNYDSVTAFLTWITKEQAAGNMDRADAKELRDHAKAMIVALRARHQEHELEEMRQLVASAEDAVKRGQAQASADRYGRGGKAKNCDTPLGANASKGSGNSAGSKTGT
jgi:Xaa-Pro aminopeptidase